MMFNDANDDAVPVALKIRMPAKEKKIYNNNGRPGPMDATAASQKGPSLLRNRIKPSLAVFHPTLYKHYLC